MTIAWLWRTLSQQPLQMELSKDVGYLGGKELGNVSKT